MPQHPNLYPLMTRVEADLWDQLPTDLSALLAILPQADLYRARMRSKWPFTQRSLVSGRDIGRRGQRRPRGTGREPASVYGFGLVEWRDGWEGGRVAPGRTAEVFCEPVRTAVARSTRRGRIALVIRDPLKTHTSAGSLLVREPGETLIEGARVPGVYACL